MSDEPDRMPYLVQHPPARRQFRTTRRSTPTGAIVVHTFENAADLNPPDTKAEDGAAFIVRRTDAAGSYHTVVDSDSTVQLGYYTWEMFGEGTGGNRWALHLSFACRAAQWATLPSEWVEGAIEQAAAEAARMARWVETEHGIVVPARRINASEYRNQSPGFIAHGDVDPDRRTDPGRSFPWLTFLDRYAAHHHQGDTMMPTRPYPTEDIKTMQVLLDGLDYNLGPSGIDGILGPDTMAALRLALSDLHQVGSVTAGKARLLDRLYGATKQIEGGEQALKAIRGEIRDAYEAL